MAEFALPKHSKVVKGIDYPLDTDSTNTRKVNVYRWSPDDDENPFTNLEAFFGDTYD